MDEDGRCAVGLPGSFFLLHVAVPRRFALRQLEARIVFTAGRMKNLISTRAGRRARSGSRITVTLNVLPLDEPAYRMALTSPSAICSFGTDLNATSTGRSRRRRMCGHHSPAPRAAFWSFIPRDAIHPMSSDAPTGCPGRRPRIDATSEIPFMNGRRRGEKNCAIVSRHGSQVAPTAVRTRASV